jgi:hypothetical protein
MKGIMSLLFVSLFTLPVSATELSSDKTLELAEERIHSMVANSAETRLALQQTAGRSIASLGEEGKKNNAEFNQLMQDEKYQDYLALCDQL